MVSTSYIVDVFTLAVAIVAIIISIGSTTSAKRNYVLMRTETIEKHINEFVIKHKRDIGWLPQCAALRTYPLAHIFHRPIFDDYMRLTELEREKMFERYRVTIPTLIPKGDLRKGMALLFDDMASNGIIAEKDRDLIKRHMSLVSEYAGNIKEVTGMPFLTDVGPENNSPTETDINGTSDEAVYLRDYIRSFLDRKADMSPMDKIMQIYGEEDEKVQIVRFAELCYFSLINLDKEDRAFHMSNEISLNIKYFEDAGLSIALGAYLLYIYEGEPFEPDIPFDMTTLSKEH